MLKIKEMNNEAYVKCLEDALTDVMNSNGYWRDLTDTFIMSYTRYKELRTLWEHLTPADKKHYYGTMDDYEFDTRCFDAKYYSLRHPMAPYNMFRNHDPSTTDYIKAAERFEEDDILFCKYRREYYGKLVEIKEEFLQALSERLKIDYKITDGKIVNKLYDRAYTLAARGDNNFNDSKTYYSDIYKEVRYLLPLIVEDSKNC